MENNIFYFNTGVTHTVGGYFGKAPQPIEPGPGQVWRGGTLQIPFRCSDVPEKAQFIMACDNPELNEARDPAVIVREILPGSGLLSKYAYFRIPAAA